MSQAHLLDPPTANASPATPLERRLLSALRAGMGHPPVTFVLWNGEELPPARGASRGRVHVRDRRVLRQIALGTDLVFGDAYTEGRIEVEGELAPLLEAVFRAGLRQPTWFRTLSCLLGFRPRGHGLRRARQNVHHHYDLGNDFYRLWLDERMVYTCGYFPTPEATLEEAQLAKLDLVCRKLALRPGERVVEAGCGWGALALHMAENWGVRVRAFNVSREQIAWARQRALERGLDKLVEFVEEDWRVITGRFDAFVSVGMLEHVGRTRYGELGRLVSRCLAPGGRGLLHFIGHARPTPTSPWLERRIFPGAYMPALSEALRVIEPHHLAVVDVENLRRHYALTLEHWLARFERARAAVERAYDARFVRMWRLYLASSLASFRSGSTQLWQIVFARSDDAALPWTRRA
jgi:cyclopropane-fatty-acyl-phospholipid synthase